MTTCDHRDTTIQTDLTIIGGGWIVCNDCGAERHLPLRRYAVDDYDYEPDAEEAVG